MKEYQEVLIVHLVFILRLALVILHLKHLCSDISKCCDICSYCSDRLIHLDDLFKHEFLLTFLHQRHNFGAVQNEILLPLLLQLLRLLQMVHLVLHQLHLLQNIFEFLFTDGKHSSDS